MKPRDKHPDIVSKSWRLEDADIYFPEQRETLHGTIKIKVEEFYEQWHAWSGDTGTFRTNVEVSGYIDAPGTAATIPFDDRGLPEKFDVDIVTDDYRAHIGGAIAVDTFNEKHNYVALRARVTTEVDGTEVTWEFGDF